MTRPMDVVLRGTRLNASRVISAQGTLDDAALAARIDALVAWLARTGIRRVASRLDNGSGWFVLDLALREIGGVHVPLPVFFSEAQVRHALASSGAQCVVTAREDAMPPGVEALSGFVDGERLACWRTPAHDTPGPELPHRTACITYTSGTTGRPRGVCLDADTLFTVAASLVGALYYLRVVKVMWFDEVADASPISTPLDMRVVLSLNGILVVILGVLPGPLLAACLSAMSATLKS